MTIHITEEELQADIPDNWCVYHQMPEIVPVEGAQYCGECGHAWVDMEHLVNDANKLYIELGWPTRTALEIWVCPYCSHDL